MMIESDCLEIIQAYDTNNRKLKGQNMSNKGAHMAIDLKLVGTKILRRET